MIESLNDVQQRILALGLFVAISFLLLTLLAWPVISKHKEYDGIIEELVFRIKRYKRVIAMQDQVFNQVEITRTKISDQGYISDLENEALASAELQKFIKDVIIEAGGKLNSTQVLPSLREGELTRISVKVRLSGTVEVLRTLVYALETQNPLLIIKQIDINPQRGRRNRITKKFESSNLLNINMMVIGYMGKID